MACLKERVLVNEVLHGPLARKPMRQVMEHFVKVEFFARPGLERECGYLQFVFSQHVVFHFKPEGLERDEDRIKNF